MPVIASGYAIDGDAWWLDAQFDRHTGELFTSVLIELPDGSRPWSGGCGGPPLDAARRISTYLGAADVGPRTFIARVDGDLRL